MRLDTHDRWAALLDEERSVAMSNAHQDRLFTARRVLVVATLGTAGVAIALPLIVVAGSFAIGLLHEGVGTIRALLGR